MCDQPWPHRSPERNTSLNTDESHQTDFVTANASAADTQSHNDAVNPWPFRERERDKTGISLEKSLFFIRSFSRAHLTGQLFPVWVTGHEFSQSSQITLQWHSLLLTSVSFSVRNVLMIVETCSRMHESFFIPNSISSLSLSLSLTLTLILSLALPYTSYLSPSD